MSISPPRGQSTVAEKDQLMTVSILPGCSDCGCLQGGPRSTDATRHVEEVADDQTLIVKSVAGDANTLPPGTIGLELARIVAAIVSYGPTARKMKDQLLTLRCKLGRCWHQ